MSERVQGKYRRKNDPYNNMETFLPSQKIKNSRDLLKKSEDQASQKTETKTAATAEKLFRNSVKGKPVANLAANKFKKYSKRLSPFALLFVVFLATMGVLGTSQGLLGAQLTHIFTEITDLQFSSSELTKIRLTKRDLKNATLSKDYKARLKENGITVKGKKFKYKDQTYSAKQLEKALDTDIEFQTAFSKSIYGRSSGQFDKPAKKIYKKYGAVRQLFANSKVRNSYESKRAFRGTISRRTDGTAGNISTGTRQETEEGGSSIERTGDDTTIGGVEGNTPETKARSFVNDIASKADLGGNIACTALQVANLISITAAANQTIKAISYFLGIMEPISRTMDSETSPHMNDALNELTQKTTSTIEYIDKNGNEKTAKYTGSMLEASALKNILSESKVDRRETKNFSPSIFTSSVIAAFATNRAAINTCTGVRAASAIVSLAATGIPGGQIITLSVGTIVRVFTRVAVAAGLMTILSTLIPYVARVFFTPTFEAYTGVAAGNLFSYGGIQNNFRLAQQASGYMPASEERMREQNKNYQVALDREAKVNRQTHSPLDASNPHTFLGTLASSTVPTLATATSLSSFTSAFGNLISKSSSSLLPTASALGTNNSYTSDMEDCEDLPGSVCDGFGINFPSTDFSTLKMDYDDPIYKSVIQRNLNADGTINGNSNLAQFITFCAGRESPWGVSDANILAALQTDGGVILNNLPVVGDVLDLVNAVEDTVNEAWATGLVCTNSEDNPIWEKEFKYYQRYMEDSRIDSHLTGAENPVTAFQEKYEKEHPVDNSYEGILARFSGLTKDQVRFALEVVNYSDYLADYHEDISNRISFDTSESVLSRNVPQAAAEEEAARARKDGPRERRFRDETESLVSQRFYLSSKSYLGVTA